MKSTKTNLVKYHYLFSKVDEGLSKTGQHIPRIIHQTGKSQTDLPADIAKNIETLKLLNPDWEYRFYDDSDIQKFILDTYGEGMWQYYDKINFVYGAARADLFRYLLVYAVGGVYLDLKSTATKPLSQFIGSDDHYILSHWDNEPGEYYQDWGCNYYFRKTLRGEFQQWHVIASAGHPFLRAVICNVLAKIDAYTPCKLGVGQYAVLNATGPFVYTDTVLDLIEKEQHSYRLISYRDWGLVYSIYESEENSFVHNKVLGSNYRTCTQSLVKGDFDVNSKRFVWFNKNVIEQRNLLLKKVYQYHRSIHRAGGLMGFATKIVKRVLQR